MCKRLLLVFLAVFLFLAPFSHASGGLHLENPPQEFKQARIKNGFAVPALGTPQKIVRALRAGNRIAKKPYAWGGGHSLWSGSIENYLKKSPGFDCSGSVSFLLGRFGGGWLKRPRTSGSFLSWGKGGKGRWFTVWTGQSHAYLVIAGLRFDTSGLDERGTRWSAETRGMRGLSPRRLR